MSARRLIPKLALSLAMLLLGLGALEIVLRLYDRRPAADSGGAPLHVVVDAPHLYGLNPEHEEINAQGLRGRPVATPKPDGRFRVLILGDSVAYGEGVASDSAFPQILERMLAKRGETADVINAGVSGYTTYNEVEYYLARGRDLAPDLVILALCLNDVANPRLHWNYTGEAAINVPGAAIPNRAYDRDVIQPRLEARAAVPSPLQRSALWRALRAGIGALGGRNADDAAIPTRITGEDDLSIEVWLDRETPEWRWLAAQLDRLKGAVRADGAELAVAVMPLAYQLDPGYPHLPQRLIGEFCAERNLLFIDPLPAMRRHAAREVFQLDRAGFHDIWHFTPRGHELCAEAILLAIEPGNKAPATAGAARSNGKRDQ